MVQSLSLADDAETPTPLWWDQEPPAAPRHCASPRPGLGAAGAGVGVVWSGWHGHRAGAVLWGAPALLKVSTGN